MSNFEKMRRTIALTTQRHLENAAKSGVQDRVDFGILITGSFDAEKNRIHMGSSIMLDPVTMPPGKLMEACVAMDDALKSAFKKLLPLILMDIAASEKMRQVEDGSEHDGEIDDDLRKKANDALNRILGASRE